MTYRTDKDTNIQEVEGFAQDHTASNQGEVRA